MSRIMKKSVSVLLALFIAAAAFFAVPPVRTAAESAIVYSLSYTTNYVKITFSPQKSTNTIYYTVDGTAPTKASKLYKKTLASKVKVTIRAVEYNKSGSRVASLKVTIMPRVQTPVIKASTSGGKQYLTITTGTYGAKIYYTTNGSTPTEKSKLYSGKIAYTAGSTVKARAYKSNMKASKTVSYTSEDDEELSGATDSLITGVLEQVNKERTSRGLKALVLDDELCAAAAVRAKEIVDTYSHTRPNGSSCSTILGEMGIDWRTTGENIAYGWNKLFTAEDVVARWMESEGHRANILAGKFGKLGVGYVRNGDKIYWVQIFTD